MAIEHCVLGQELAAASRHLVASDVGRVAAQANVGSLIVVHISDRYSQDEWHEQLAEVRAVFPKARFPDNWQMDSHHPTAAQARGSTP